MATRSVKAAVSYRDLPAPSLVKAAFTLQGWIFALKYDGFRVLAGRHRDAITLVSRRGTNLLPCYPEIGECLKALPDLALDGELVLLDEQGRPQFERLRRRSLSLRGETKFTERAPRLMHCGNQC